MELAVNDLYIRNLNAIVEGTKVVFIGEDPFSPQIWEEKVQSVRSVQGTGILVGCEGFDSHNEIRNYHDWRIATVAEIESGLIDPTVQALYVGSAEDADDDADIDDSEDDPMPEFETQEEFDEAEERARNSSEDVQVAKDEVEILPTEPKRKNDFSGSGMSNSIVTGTDVVVLEGYEDAVAQIVGSAFDNESIYRVTGHKIEDDTIQVLGVWYPATYFRYAINKEVNMYTRDADFNQNAVRDIRDVHKEIARLQARMNTESLDDEAFPLWVRAGIAQEYMDALNTAGFEQIKYVENEIERLRAIKNGEKYNSVISYDKIKPLKDIIRHILVRVGLEFHSGHSISSHVQVIRTVLARAEAKLRETPESKSSLKMLQELEYDLYGGREKYFELFKAMDAFSIVFLEEGDNFNQHASTFELTVDQIQDLLGILQSVILSYPLSDLTLKEEEWELRGSNETTGHYSYSNKRYSRVSRDINIDGSVEVITELDSITFVDSLDLSTMYTSPNSVVVHPNVPFMPNNDIYVYVGEDNKFFIPVIDMNRLTPDKSILLKYNGTVYVFKSLDNEAKTVTVVQRGTSNQEVISFADLNLARSFSKDKMFSVQHNPDREGTPKEDLPYPSYHAVYNDGAPQ